MAAGVVIVGGGQAGLEAAAALRAQGYQEPVTLIGEERHAPYQRPPLSKEYLLGKQTADHLPLRAPNFYENHQIVLRTGQRVTSINRAAKCVVLESGDEVSYDKLILAVGARNRVLAVRGSTRLLYLRTRDEADVIKERISSATNVAVIGGGFIGLEIAAAARTLGRSVVIVESMPRLMARAVPPILSDFFRDMHERQGSKVILGATVVEITSDGFICSHGTHHVADLVIAGIGVVPNTELASQAGLTCDNGIVVDEYLRTDDPDIYAIGDCSNHPNRFAEGRVRLESVQNAVDQAKCAAKGIMGTQAPYRDVPWFWTDQFGIRFQMVGLSSGHDQQVVRGSAADHKFSVFYFKQRRLLAVDSVNRFGDHVAARKILASGTAITPEQAADETVDLKKLI
jgi:3-phenylpropionate/trans-cinnamate dioxygenase ferredoxin reductase subunit